MLWIILATLPFLLPLLQHFLLTDAATGFISYEAPYYVANGREVFERGNGFAHPNPFDPAADSPAIYFHWLTWLFGFGVKVLHCDPGLFFAGLGVIAALWAASCTLRLVEHVLPDPSGRMGLYLLTMWGGGLLSIAGLVAGPAGQPLSATLMAYDPAAGWWFFNWGRNLTLTTEAVYHGLVALGWLGVLQRRWRLAFGAIGALAATHPFSGLQHLLILGAWVGVLAVRERTPAAWGRLALATALLAIFGAYYFGYLELFAAHRALRANWSKPWDVSLAITLLSAAPPLALALWRWQRQRWRLTEGDWFLLLAAAITFLLMKHDWFIAARQPVHFSHGYNWLPWWLIALPELQAWWRRHATDARRWPALLATAGASAVLVSDNVAFLAVELTSGEVQRQHLDAAQREMFRWMDGEKLDGVMLCADTRLAYLSATYTGVRPYLGHVHNTPNAQARWQQIKAWHERGEGGSWLATIDYVLVDRLNAPRNFDRAAWRELHGNDEYVLLGRVPR
jgi:hypothetical protein